MINNKSSLSFDLQWSNYINFFILKLFNSHNLCILFSTRYTTNKLINYDFYKISFWSNYYLFFFYYYTIYFVVPLWPRRQERKGEDNNSNNVSLLVESVGCFNVSGVLGLFVALECVVSHCQCNRKSYCCAVWPVVLPDVWRAGDVPLVPVVSSSSMAFPRKSDRFRITLRPLTINFQYLYNHRKNKLFTTTSEIILCEIY